MSDPMSDPTPDPDVLLRQLELATRRGVRLSSLDDADSAGLNEGWRALDQVLSQGTPRGVPTGMAYRVLKETHRRESQRRRVRWTVATIAVSAAAVVLLASVGLLWPPHVEQVAQETKTPEPVATEPRVERTVVPELVPQYPEYVAQDGNDNAEIDVWNEVDTEIAATQDEFVDLQDQWNVSNTYLDYVARQFDEMETALAMMEL